MVAEIAQGDGVILFTDKVRTRLQSIRIRAIRDSDAAHILSECREFITIHLGNHSAILDILSSSLTLHIQTGLPVRGIGRTILLDFLQGDRQRLLFRLVHTQQISQRGHRLGIVHGSSCAVFLNIQETILVKIFHCIKTITVMEESRLFFDDVWNTILIGIVIRRHLRPHRILLRMTPGAGTGIKGQHISTILVLADDEFATLQQTATSRVGTDALIGGSQQVHLGHLISKHLIQPLKTLGVHLFNQSIALHNRGDLIGHLLGLALRECLAVRDILEAVKQQQQANDEDQLFVMSDKEVHLYTFSICVFRKVLW